MAERASTHWLDCARTSSKPIPSRDVCFCSAADGALRSASWSMTGRGSGWRRSGWRRGDLCIWRAECRVYTENGKAPKNLYNQLKYKGLQGFQEGYSYTLGDMLCDTDYRSFHGCECPS